MNDLRRSIAALHPGRFRKDVSNHHIPTGEVPSMQDMLDAAEREDKVHRDINHYGYLRDVGVANEDLASRLRHRATLMRLRADQFDDIADRYRDAHLASLEAAVRAYDELSISIQRLLEEHKHVEPTKV